MKEKISTLIDDWKNRATTSNSTIWDALANAMAAIAAREQRLESLAAKWRLRALSFEGANVTLSAQVLRECADELVGNEVEPRGWFAHEQEVERLRAEIAGLKEELSTQEQNLIGYQNAENYWKGNYDKSQTELAECRKDAERYRWLRQRADARMEAGSMFASFDSWVVLSGTYVLDEDGCAPVDHADLDRAIDAALAQQKGKGEGRPQLPDMQNTVKIKARLGRVTRLEPPQVDEQNGKEEST